VFSVQLVTGVLLMTAYSPGDTTAWSSVYFIQYKMDFGWLIRGLHHFGSQTMVVLLGVHMLQVVIAGAHLKPREVNWWLGLGLLGVVLGLSLTGYLLPWDQKGYYATQVATNIAGNVPVIRQ
jgi:ubiquinol-cytochrome c reductase cytochrome b subunit